MGDTVVHVPYPRLTPDASSTRFRQIRECSVLIPSVLFPPFILPHLVGFYHYFSAFRVGGVSDLAILGGTRQAVCGSRAIHLQGGGPSPHAGFIASNAKSG